MDANLHGARAAQDLSPDSVPKTSAEQREENLVGFYYKLSVTLQEGTFLSLIVLFIHGNTGFVWFSWIHF